MKYWKPHFGNWKATTIVALAVLNLAVGTAADATPPRKADPFEKGAIQQLSQGNIPPEVLPSEINNPVLIPLVGKWRDLPIEPRSYPTVRSNCSVNIAIHIIRKAPGKPVLVCIHGLLADYLTWEYVAAALADDYEIWLMDLPGCGDSDAPKPSTIEPDGYSPTAMGERVWQALRQCLAAEAGAPPRQITLVGHSLGSTVVIRMLSAPELKSRYAPELEHVDRAVLFAPCDLAMNAVPPCFSKLLGLKGWMITAGDVLGVLDGKVRNLTKRSFQLPEFATIERQECYAHALRDSGHREGAIAMVLSFTPFDRRTGRPIWPEIERLVAEYRNVRVPVLIVHGTWDETLTSNMGHALKDHIPGAMLVEVPGRSHSLPTEDPLVCARLIERFQQGQRSEVLVAGLNVDFFSATTMIKADSLLTSTPVRVPKTTTSAPSP